MIHCDTGIPGSGKTYRAVDFIAKSFFKSKSDYLHLYTNINEFDFDLFKSRTKKSRYNNNTISAYSLNFDLFYKHLTELFQMYKNGSSDSDLLVYLDSKKLSYSLLVLDEAHNFLKAGDDVMVWFFTYHRHLYVDIIIITQDLNLINKKFYSLVELYYYAVKRSKSLSDKTLRYMLYVSSSLSKDSMIETFSLKKDDSVFNLYHSGDSVKVKTYLKTMIIKLSLGVIFVIGLMVFAYNKVIVSKQDMINSPNVNKSFVVAHDSSDNVFLILSCAISNNRRAHLCSLKDTDIIYDASFVFDTMKNNNKKYIYTTLVEESEDAKLFEYEYILDKNFVFNNFPRFYEEINKTIKNEKEIGSDKNSTSSNF